MRYLFFFWVSYRKMTSMLKGIIKVLKLEKEKKEKERQKVMHSYTTLRNLSAALFKKLITG